MSLKKTFNSKQLPNGDELTTFANGSTLTVYGESYADGHGPGEQIWRNAKGQKDRTDGPAVEWPSGHKEWWREGKLSREDGPAVERPASGNHEYWIQGKKVAKPTAAAPKP